MTASCTLTITYTLHQVCSKPVSFREPSQGSAMTIIMRAIRFTANAGAAPGGGNDVEEETMILPLKDGSARTAEG